jgi:stalled ribosome rescue protein Dom34
MLCCTYSYVQVIKELSSGSSASNRQVTTVTVAVEGMEYDSDKGSLRISGKNTEENDYIRVRDPRSFG